MHKNGISENYKSTRHQDTLGKTLPKYNIRNTQKFVVNLVELIARVNKLGLAYMLLSGWSAYSYAYIIIKRAITFD